MKIIRAAHLGMCFGVRDAIDLAKATSRTQPLTILGDLVHNESVLADLRAHGIRIEQDSAKVSTPTVMITAHGASEQMLQRVRGQGLNVVEATCPLVHYAHRAVKKLAKEGFHPVIVGKRDHVEVRGMTEDLESFDVVLNEEDVHGLAHYPRYGVASQTTQPIERVRHLAGLIQQHHPQAQVRLVDTVCQPTRQRQSAATELARQCDVVIVIGGLNSNNTRELVGTCRQFCARVFHVQQAGDLRAEWFEEEQTIGITAGTSTPDWIIDAVEAALTKLPQSSSAMAETQ